MENYEQKYKDALEKAKCLIQNEETNIPVFYVDNIKDLFSELRESEDEKIRNEIIKFLELPHPQFVGKRHQEDWIAWLEKQELKSNPYSGVSFSYNGNIWGMCARDNGVDILFNKKLIYHINGKKQIEQKEATCVADIIDRLSDKEQDILFKELEIQKEQKSAEKVKSKFKVGDWVIDKSFGSIKQIKHFDNDEKVWFTDGTGTFIEFLEGYRLWAIKDAKPGDVLHATGWHSDCIFIFSGLDNWKFDEPDGEKALATSYCCIHVYSDMIEFGTQGPDCIEVNTVKPATKIQCDLLFRNIRENGYEWDANALELKKISLNKEDIKPFTIEHGKYYYCIEDYWSGGNKRASKGDVVQALRGMNMMALNSEEAANYFLPVNSIKQKSNEWDEEDEKMFRSLHNIIYVVRDCDCDSKGKKELSDWLKSLRLRNTWKPSKEQIMALRWFLNNVPYNKYKEEISGLLDQIKEL